MKTPQLSIARGFALGASLLGLLMVTAVPVLTGPTVFSAKIAFEWMTFVAVVWAAAIAAENLDEVRRTRLAGFEPLLDLSISERRERGRVTPYVTVRNLGRGAAVGLRLVLYREDHDEVEWLPAELESIPDALSADGVASADLDVNPLLFLLQDEAPAHLLIGIEYRDPLGREHTEIRAFHMRKERHRERFRRVSGRVPLRTGKKAQYLQAEVERFALEHGIEQRGFGLVGAVDRDSMSVSLRDRNGKQLFLSVRPVTDSVATLLEHVRERLDHSGTDQNLPTDGPEFGPRVEGDPLPERAAGSTHEESAEA